MSGLVLPSSKEIVRDVVSVHVHPVETCNLKLGPVLDALDDLFLQHDLAETPGFTLVFFSMLNDPSVDVSALGASDVLGEPAILIVLDVDVVPHQLSQFL